MTPPTKRIDSLSRLEDTPSDLCASYLTYTQKMEANADLVVSPPLIYHGDFSEPVPEEFDRIFIHLFSDTLEDKPCLNDNYAKIDEVEDELFIQASQLYEKSRAENDSEEAINQLLLKASQ